MKNSLTYILMHTMVVAVCFSALTNCVYAQQSFDVKSGDDIEALLESGKLAAGDTILWSAGNYSDMEVDIVGIDGTEDLPITLKAATPGAVVFSGETQFTVGSKHWVISGFHFTGVEGKFNAYNTFQFRSGSGQGAQHVRLTDCAFTNMTSEDSTSKWVLIYGQSNSIDHCHFSGKNKKGALITVELAYLDAEATAGHQISHNYFGDVAFQEGSDNETIRIGSSEDQNKQAKCVVSENYFVRCNGENEIISSKSSYNVFERNTFRQCDGALVLRHGHHAKVDGNFFFGDGAKNSGGIRVVDSHHVITNNYLQDLTGTTWNSALSILGGSQASGGTTNGYQAVDNIFIAHNSILNCQRSIFLNKAKGKRTPTGVVANNLISSASEPLVKADLSSAKLQWSSNLMHGAAIGADLDAITTDPMLKETDGLLRPDASGPAAGAAAKCDVIVAKDIDGQARSDAGADIGADEVTGVTGEIVSVPLTPADVGVSFLRGKGPDED